MSNPSGPGQGHQPAVESTGEPAGDASTTEDSAPTEAAPVVSAEAAPIVEEHPTEVMAVEDTGALEPDTQPEEEPAERRYTAPSGMDSSATKFIERPPDPATEVFSTPTQPLSSGKSVAPQMIAGRGDAPSPPGRRRSWGWVVALILVIAALAAVAILGTLLLTRDSDSKESQQDMVRSTIQNFDVAVQNGDLATLRSITCGATRDSYVNYDDPAVGRHSRPGRRGQAVSGGGQHRPGRGERRPCRGQRDDVHGLRPANPVHPQFRPAVPRRPVEDLPGAEQLT
jgi:hypothetical protein